MKLLYYLSTVLILSSCSSIDFEEESFVGTNKNKPHAARMYTDKLSHDHLTGETWIGTDLHGKKSYFNVDTNYTLIVNDTINNTFFLLTGDAATIQYDGDQFYISNKTENKSYQIMGTAHLDENKLHLALFSNPDFEILNEFIYKRQHEQVNIIRPEREIIDPPNTVYRRDTRDPSEIFTNGFSPRGRNDDMVAHVVGVSLYQPGVPLSGWVSATASLNWVTNPSQPMPNEEFWVYVIVPTSNAYSVINSFQHFIANTTNEVQRRYVNRLIQLYEGQHEWAFLGNIPARNIRRAIRYRFDHGEYRQVETRENPNYNQHAIPSGNPTAYSIFSTLPGFENQYFRSDIRSPEQIIEARGIIQDGINDDENDYLHWAQDVGQINLYRHSRTLDRDSYGFLSISNALWAAHMEGSIRFRGTSVYYIYVLAQAPNIFNTSNILGTYRNRDNHFSALGGIPITQIVGWYTVTDGHISEEMTPNSSYYRQGVFSGLNIIDGVAGYPYAGFPLAHRAWTEYPWDSYAPEYCLRKDFKREAEALLSGPSWCEYNTNTKSKELFHSIKIQLYTSIFGPR